MHKFQKKKDNKKQTKKQAEKVQKKEEDEEEEQPITLNVQIAPQVQEKEKPKAPKVPAKVIDETQIDYAMKNPNQGKTQVRISWVPQQGGVVKKFDYEKQKQHFVAIGEDYTPPVQQKNSNFLPISGASTTAPTENKPPKFTNSSLATGNLQPMQKSAQQIMEQKMQAQMAGLRAPTLTKQQVQAKKRREAEGSTLLPKSDGFRKVPMFTKGETQVNNNVAPLQKTKQQLLQQQMLAQGSFQSTAVSKQQKLARQAERKKREEEAAKIISFNTGEKKTPVFTSNVNNNNTFGGVGQLEKSPQQLLEQKIQAELKAKNLQGKTMTREQIEQKKARQLERQKEEQIQQKARLSNPVEEIKISSGGPPRFFNSSKTNGDQPQFVNLK